MIPGDHDDAYSGLVTFTDCRWDFRPHRIGKRQQTKELELDVVPIFRKVSASRPRPACATEHPKPVASKLRHPTFNRASTRALEVAQLNNRLGTTLDCHDVIGALRGDP